jgi:hypothetical protein
VNYVNLAKAQPVHDLSAISDFIVCPNDSAEGGRANAFFSSSLTRIIIGEL